MFGSDSVWNIAYTATGGANNGMASLVLSVDNPTNACVMAGALDSSLDTSGNTNRLYITKTGAGIWRFADHATRNGVGGIAVEEGTLQFDTLAEKGVMCALGTAEDSHSDYYGVYDASKNEGYAFSAGSATTEGTFEYTGSTPVWVTQRPMVLNGDVRFKNDGNAAFRYANVTPKTAGAKTVKIGNLTWSYRVENDWFDDSAGEFGEFVDEKVAVVTKAGKVKGLKAGTATITCISNAIGAKATCKVLVGYVKLSDTEVCVEKGKTMTLKSKVYPTSVKDQSVTWKSSNSAIATVTSKGKVKGVKVGTAVITCTSNATGLSTVCEVTVGYVKLSDTEVTLEKGKTKALKSRVYPLTEDQTVTWKSSAPTIVKVTSTGKIKGVKVGKATITCISNATGLKATCEVTVTKASAAPSLDGSDDEVTSIEEKAALAEEFDVYDLNGRRVLNKVTSLDGLSNGVYIVNGKKIVVKK